jgi:molybdenum cofactor cytidylyltransferase
MQRAGLIILAAEASFRLGQPKQLLPFQGETLISRAAHTALASQCHPVIVVLGAYTELIKPEILRLPVALAYNPKWHLGVGTSIKAGLDTLAAIETAGGARFDGVLLMPGDQPLIGATVLNDLVDSFSVHGGIVACAYNNTLGFPAIFAREFSRDLRSLSPAQGINSVIERHQARVSVVDFPEGAMDIETVEDYDEVTQRLAHHGH